MAIKVDIEKSQYGVPFKGAYFRIISTVTSRLRGEHRVMIDVAGFASKPENDDVREVDFRRYHAPLSEIEGQLNIEFLAKCYAWVMEQPDMAGAQAA